MTIPGVSAIAAHVMIAELGVDMRSSRPWAPALVGRTVPATKRKCRQGALAHAAQRGAVAPDGAGPMRLGCVQQQAAQLFARPVSQAQSPSWSQESRDRSRSFNADRGLLPAARSSPLPRSRRAILRP